jgi:hypothetical protein
MSQGEFLTRLTIWITLGGYTAGTALYFTARGRRHWETWARLAWTIGCLALLAHAAFALHFYHRWQQSSAWQETARQTAEVFGVEWGGGLYINYAFMLAWVVDTIWWWRGLDAYRRRSRALTAAWHGFLIFMFFNATVVFETGVLRWLGLWLGLGLGLLWWLGDRRSRASPSARR